MAVEITLPKLTHDMQSGVFVTWHKQEGEAVRRGEALYAVETDKATADVESEADGVLARLAAQPGDEVAVGQVIAYLVAPGEAVLARGLASREDRAPDELRALTSPPVSPSPYDGEGDLNRVHAADSSLSRGKRGTDIAQDRAQSDPRAGGRVVATPLARRTARAAGVDLRAVRGSGPRGRIVRADVLAAAEPTRTAPTPGAPYTVISRTRVQAQTAARLSQMWQESPAYVLDVSADMTEALRWREKTGKRMSFTTLLVRAAAAALRRVPEVNSLWVEGELRRYHAVNVGVAMASPAGVVVPVIHDADRLAAADIQARLDTLRSRAEAGRLTLDDLRDGTFTVTNLGMYGVDAFAAVLNPPQAAILACGRIVETPAAEAGTVVIRPTLHLRLTVDHRALDGAEAAPFLIAVRDLLENPYQLI